jgi:hypothetical protein
MLNASSPSLPGLLTAFVLAFPDETLCAVCLSRRIGASVYAVRRALSKVDTTTGLAVTTGLCAGCRHQARLLRADPSCGIAETQPV